MFRELLENRSFSDGAGGVMCPLRVILLFLSALLAGYFALKTFRNEEGSSNGFLDMKNEDRQPDASAKVLLEEQGNVFHKVIIMEHHTLSVLNLFLSVSCLYSFQNSVFFLAHFLHLQEACGCLSRSS